MALTSPAPANRKVEFKGDVTRERPRGVDMPAVSQAQARLMFAAKEGDVPGISPSVGAEFTQGLKGPGAVKALPKKAAGAPSPPKRTKSGSILGDKALAEGRITAAQHRRMYGG